MKDERLVRGQAAAQHNHLTEVPLAEAADSELLQRIAMGSEEAFRTLWDRFGAGVYTASRAHDQPQSKTPRSKTVGETQTCCSTSPCHFTGGPSGTIYICVP